MTARAEGGTEEATATNGTDDGLLDVAVIGGSQAGLAMAWHLARAQLRFVVLEAAPAIGHTWRSRWDSLTLFTPTQYNALPGMPFPGPPDTYPPRIRSPSTCRPTQRRSTFRSSWMPGLPTSARRRKASRSAPRMRRSAPARWWWRPDRSRCRSSHRPPSGWTAR